MATGDCNNSGDVFCYWITANADSGGTTSTTANDYAWDSWHGSTGTHTGTDIDYSGAWGAWQQTGHTVTYIARSSKPIPIPVESTEKKRARLAQREINKIWRDLRIKEEEERKRKAELTAQALLEDLITEDEMEYYKETGRLVVKGRKNDYVITKGSGVQRVEKDKVKDFCIHFKEQYKYPKTDNVIALKLLLESSEKEFLRIANDHGELRAGSRKQKALEAVNRAA